ncbi:DUF4013 domain-containing protein [Halospeciosus flavus]|uniref:DUF4013 domain-containing protein n=1 Tax=Halospeciosus flavus TaxID=3032283 RepID=A0ABD5Z8T3_9EURY|nr:DUF4013 domain-containing protein [Halospeciosus flavus]
MFEDSLTYPKRGDDALVTLLVGGFLPLVATAIAVLGVVLSAFGIGLLLLPLAVVPQLALSGYFVAVARRRLDGVHEPPAFDDWKQLFVDGVKITLAQIGYAVPLLVLWFVGLVVFFVGALAGRGGPGQNAVGMVGGVVFLLLCLVTVVYGLAVAYVFPVALVNFAREDDLGAAFDLDVLKAVSFDGDYAVAWLLAAVVYVIGAGTLGPMLVWVFFLGFVVIFYAQVSAVYLVVEGYVDALDLEREREQQATLPQSVSADERGGERADVETENEVAVKGAEVYPTVEEESEASESESSDTDAETESDADTDEEVGDESHEPDQRDEDDRPNESRRDE